MQTICEAILRSCTGLASTCGISENATSLDLTEGEGKKYYIIVYGLPRMHLYERVVASVSSQIRSRSWDWSLTALLLAARTSREARFRRACALCIS